MTTTFISVILKWAENASPEEVEELRKLLALPKDMDLEIIQYSLKDERILGIKYIKGLTGWDLRTCKEYLEKVEDQYKSKTGQWA